MALSLRTSANIKTRSRLKAPGSGQQPDAVCRVPSAEQVLDLIGNTPLLPLTHIGEGLNGVRLLAKAEWFNPGGSVKDRAAASMIAEAEAAGQLTPGKTILDASSGNTAVAEARDPVRMARAMKNAKAVRLVIAGRSALYPGAKWPGIWVKTA